MGLEARDRSLPTNEKERKVRSEIQKSFESLLSRGGIITHNGQIVDIGLENLQDVTVFTEEQRDTLVRTRTLKLKANDMRHLLPDGRTIKYISSHIILPNTDKVLGYRTGRNGGTHLFIRGTRNGGMHDYSIGAYWQLGHAFAEYARTALDDEELRVPSTQRYSDEILGDIAQKVGIGEVPQKYSLEEILNN